MVSYISTIARTSRCFILLIFLTYSRISMIVVKDSKAEANYRAATDTRRCANCAMYVPPAGCTSVRGEISPHGLCDYFKRKEVLRARANSRN